MYLAKRTGALVLKPRVHTHAVELVPTRHHSQDLALLVALQADGARLRDGRAPHARIRVTGPEVIQLPVKVMPTAIMISLAEVALMVMMVVVIVVVSITSGVWTLVRAGL